MASLLTVLYCAKIVSEIIIEYLGTNAHYIHKYDNITNKLGQLNSYVVIVP